MKRFLAVACGVGLGHATRLESVVKELRRESKVEVLSHGQGYQYFRNIDDTTKLIHGLNLVFREGILSGRNSLVANLHLPLSLCRNLRLFKQIVQNHNPSHIISDSELYSILIARFLNRPCTVITNLIPTLLDCCHIPRKLFDEIRTSVFILRGLIFLLLKYVDTIISPTFLKYNIRFPKNTHLISPIIRNKTDEISNQSSNVSNLVLLGADIHTQRALLQRLIPQLKRRKGNFTVIGYHGVSEPMEFSNIKILPFTRNPLGYLKSCTRVLSMAGHSILSEILVHKKPALLFPIRGHIEQLSNAYGLKRMNHADCVNPIQMGLKRKLDSFFEGEEEIRENLIKTEYLGSGASEATRIIYSLNGSRP